MQDTIETTLTYDEFINNILSTRGRFACGEEYHERHHIVPQCMGGTNAEDNLIDLFAREHFEAHRLLALENPENNRLVYAWWMMAHVKNSKQDRIRVTAKEYENAKTTISIMLRGRPAHNKGVPLSEETKKKLSEAHKGKLIGAKNPWYGKHPSEETRKKMRENHADFSGKNHPMYGKHLSEETKRKISEGHQNLSKEARQKMSESAKARCTEEWRQKKSEQYKNKFKGEKNPNSKIVIQYNTQDVLIKTWIYVKQASIELHINKNCISSCCLGKHKTAGGYHWRYLHDQTRKDGTVIPGAITLGLITEEEALKQLNTIQND